MAPLAANITSNDSLNDGTTGGMSHMMIVDIVVGIVLGLAAMSAFVIFGTKGYRVLVKWWKSRHAAPSSPAPSTSTLPASAQRVRGGVTPPTASLPRFAQNLSAAMHLPRPNTSSHANRPVSSLRAYPTGMGPSHARRGSEASTNSRVGLLPVRVSPPPSPKPAFLGRGVATGQGLTR